MTQYVHVPLGGGGIVTYPTFSDFPALATDGAAAIALDTDVFYIYNLPTTTWLPSGAPGSAVSIGAPANGLSLALQEISLGLSSTSTIGALSDADWNLFNHVTGTGGSFAGFNTITGLVGDLPGWTFQADGSSDVYTNFVVPDDTGGDSIYEFQAEIQPTQDTTDYNVTGANFDFHLDRSTQGFNFGGQFSAIGISDTKEGAGDDGNHRTININQNLGDGVEGSIGDSNVLNIDVNLNPGLTVNSYDVYYTNVQQNATVTNNYRFFASDQEGSGVISGNFTGYHLNTDLTVTQDADMIGIFSNGPVGHDYRGLDLDNNGAIGHNYNAINLFNNATVGGDFTGYQQGNLGNVTGNYQAFNVNNQGAIAGNYSGLGLFSLGGGTGNIAGDFTGITVGINSGGGTLGGGVNLINVYNNATMVGTGKDFDGVSISNDAGAPRSNTGININLQGTSQNATGVNVNMSSVTTGQLNRGLEINGGGIANNYDVSTANFTGGGEFQVNSIGSNFTIAAGHPIIDGSFGFLNNIGSTLILQDDMGPDSTGVHLGLSLNGFVGQVVADSGVVVDTVNFMTAGASVPDVGINGGTITNMSFFRSLGLLPSGGTLNITNVYGFRVDSLLTATGPTNAWGVWVGDGNADNWFAKNVVVGGSTGKPTSGKALDITGDALVSGDLAAATVTPANGASGTFTTADAKTVTVVNGIITSIV